MPGMAPKNDRVVSATLRVPTLLVLPVILINFSFSIMLIAHKTHYKCVEKAGPNISFSTISIS